MASSRNCRRMSNTARNCAPGKPRPASRRRGLGLVLGGAIASAVSVPVLAGPVGEQVTHGDASFDRNGNTTTITTSDQAIIEYQSFDVSQFETIQFIQPNSSSRVLNRINGATPSFLNGTILANGTVMFVNPAGVFFGPNAFVNVGKLYAAAGNISDADFLSGVDRFTDLSGPVVNQGTIDTFEGAHFAGYTVENFGTVVADQGMISFSSGDDVLIGRRDGHIFTRVSSDAMASHNGPRTGIVNDGTVDAGRGDVLMSAGDHVALALNSNSVLRGGMIRVATGNGGLVNAGGVLDASALGAGESGGTIEIASTDVNLSGATLDASGDAGGGTIRVGGDFHGGSLVDAGGDAMAVAQNTTVDAATSITADAVTSGDGGTAVVWADNNTSFSGSITARGGETGGNGGRAEISGATTLAMNGSADLSAPLGANGSLLLDPRALYIADNLPAALPATPGGAPTSFLTTGQIETLLLASSVELSASTTITLAGDISQGSTLATSDLTLRAGQSIVLGTGVTVRVNGDFTAVANSLQAALDSGGVRSSNDPGGFIMGAGSSLVSTLGDVRIVVEEYLPTLGNGIFQPGQIVLGDVRSATGRVGIYHFGTNVQTAAGTAATAAITQLTGTSIRGAEIGLFAAEGTIGTAANAVTVNESMGATAAARVSASTANGDIFLASTGTLGLEAADFRAFSTAIPTTSAIATAINGINTGGADLSLSVPVLTATGAINADTITLTNAAGIELGNITGATPGLDVNSAALGQMTFNSLSLVTAGAVVIDDTAGAFATAVAGDTVNVGSGAARVASFSYGDSAAGTRILAPATLNVFSTGDITFAAGAAGADGAVALDVSDAAGRIRTTDAFAFNGGGGTLAMTFADAAVGLLVLGSDDLTFAGATTATNVDGIGALATGNLDIQNTLDVNGAPSLVLESGNGTLSVSGNGQIINMANNATLSLRSTAGYAVRDAADIFQFGSNLADATANGAGTLVYSGANLAPTAAMLAASEGATTLQLTATAGDITLNNLGASFGEFTQLVRIDTDTSNAGQVVFQAGGSSTYTFAGALDIDAETGIDFADGVETLSLAGVTDFAVAAPTVAAQAIEIFEADLFTFNGGPGGTLTLNNDVAASGAVRLLDVLPTLNAAFVLANGNELEFERANGDIAVGLGADITTAYLNGYTFDTVAFDAQNGNVTLTQETASGGTELLDLLTAADNVRVNGTVITLDAQTAADNTVYDLASLTTTSTNNTVFTANVAGVDATTTMTAGGAGIGVNRSFEFAGQTTLNSQLAVAGAGSDLTFTLNNTDLVLNGVTAANNAVLIRNNNNLGIGDTNTANADVSNASVAGIAGESMLTLEVTGGAGTLTVSNANASLANRNVVMTASDGAAGTGVGEIIFTGTAGDSDVYAFTTLNATADQQIAFNDGVEGIDGVATLTIENTVNGDRDFIVFNDADGFAFNANAGTLTLNLQASAADIPNGEYELEAIGQLVFGAAVTANGVDAIRGNGVRFDGAFTSTGAPMLTIAAIDPSMIDVNAAVSANSDLTLDGTTSLGADITAGGTVAFNGPVVLSADAPADLRVSLNPLLNNPAFDPATTTVATRDSIIFAGTLDSEADAGVDDLEGITLDAGLGLIEFRGAVGGGLGLGDVVIEGDVLDVGAGNGLDATSILFSQADLQQAFTAESLTMTMDGGLIIGDVLTLTGSNASNLALEFAASRLSIRDRVGGGQASIVTTGDAGGVSLLSEGNAAGVTTAQLDAAGLRAIRSVDSDFIVNLASGGAGRSELTLNALLTTVDTVGGQTLDVRLTGDVLNLQGELSNPTAGDQPNEEAFVAINNQSGSVILDGNGLLQTGTLADTTVTADAPILVRGDITASGNLTTTGDTVLRSRQGDVVDGVTIDRGPTVQAGLNGTLSIAQTGRGAGGGDGAFLFISGDGNRFAVTGNGTANFGSTLFIGSSLTIDAGTGDLLLPMLGTLNNFVGGAPGSGDSITLLTNGGTISIGSIGLDIPQFFGGLDADLLPNAFETVTLNAGATGTIEFLDTAPPSFGTGNPLLEFTRTAGVSYEANAGSLNFTAGTYRTPVSGLSRFGETLAGGDAANAALGTTAAAGTERFTTGRTSNITFNGGTLEVGNNLDLFARATGAANGSVTLPDMILRAGAPADLTVNVESRGATTLALVGNNNQNQTDFDTINIDADSLTLTGNVFAGTVDLETFTTDRNIVLGDNVDLAAAGLEASALVLGNQAGTDGDELARLTGVNQLSIGIADNSSTGTISIVGSEAGDAFMTLMPARVETLLRAPLVTDNIQFIANRQTTLAGDLRLRGQALLSDGVTITGTTAANAGDTTATDFSFERQLTVGNNVAINTVGGDIVADRINAASAADATATPGSRASNIISSANGNSLTLDARDNGTMVDGFVRLDDVLEAGGGSRVGTLNVFGAGIDLYGLAYLTSGTQSFTATGTNAAGDAAANGAYNIGGSAFAANNNAADATAFNFNAADGSLLFNTPNGTEQFRVLGSSPLNVIIADAGAASLTLSAGQGGAASDADILLPSAVVVGGAVGGAVADVTVTARDSIQTGTFMNDGTGTLEFRDLTFQSTRAAGDAAVAGFEIALGQLGTAADPIAGTLLVQWANADRAISVDGAFTDGSIDRGTLIVPGDTTTGSQTYAYTGGAPSANAFVTFNQTDAAIALGSDYSVSNAAPAVGAAMPTFSVTGANAVIAENVQISAAQGGSINFDRQVDLRADLSLDAAAGTVSFGSMLDATATDRANFAVISDFDSVTDAAMNRRAINVGTLAADPTLINFGGIGAEAFSQSYQADTAEFAGVDNAYQFLTDRVITDGNIVDGSSIVFRADGTLNLRGNDLYARGATVTLPVLGQVGGTDVVTIAAQAVTLNGSDTSDLSMVIESLNIAANTLSVNQAMGVQNVSITQLDQTSDIFIADDNAVSVSLLPAEIASGDDLAVSGAPLALLDADGNALVDGDARFTFGGTGYSTAAADPRYLGDAAMASGITADALGFGDFRQTITTAGVNVVRNVTLETTQVGDVDPANPETVRLAGGTINTNDLDLDITTFALELGNQTQVRNFTANLGTTTANVPTVFARDLSLANDLSEIDASNRIIFTGLDVMLGFAGQTSNVRLLAPDLSMLGLVNFGNGNGSNNELQSLFISNDDDPLMLGNVVTVSNAFTLDGQTYQTPVSVVDADTNPLFAGTAGAVIRSTNDNAVIAFQRLNGELGVNRVDTTVDGVALIELLGSGATLSHQDAITVNNPLTVNISTAGTNGAATFGDNDLASDIDIFRVAGGGEFDLTLGMNGNATFNDTVITNGATAPDLAFDVAFNATTGDGGVMSFQQILGIGDGVSLAGGSSVFNGDVALTAANSFLRVNSIATLPAEDLLLSTAGLPAPTDRGFAANAIQLIGGGSVTQNGAGLMPMVNPDLTLTANAIELGGTFGGGGAASTQDLRYGNLVITNAAMNPTLALGESANLDYAGEGMFFMNGGQTTVTGSVRIETFGASDMSDIQFDGDVIGSSKFDTLLLLTNRTVGQLVGGLPTQTPVIRFLSDVGAGIEVLNLNRDANLGIDGHDAVPANATIVFGEAGGGGSFTVAADALDVGAREKIVSFGDLNIGGNTARFGDIVADGNLLVSAANATITAREAGTVFDLLTNAPQADLGTDFVASGSVNFTGTVTIEDVAGGAALPRVAVPLGNAVISTNSGFLQTLAFPGVVSDLIFGNGIVFDIQALGNSNADVSEALAGAVANVDQTAPETNAPNLSAADRDALAEIGLIIRFYEEMIAALGDRADGPDAARIAAGLPVIYDLINVSQTEPVVEATADRFTPDSILSVLGRYREVFGQQAEGDVDAGTRLGRALDEAAIKYFEELEDQGVDVEDFDADAFLVWLTQTDAPEAPAALAAADEIRSVLATIKSLGLSSKELATVRDGVINRLDTQELRETERESLVKALLRSQLTFAPASESADPAVSSRFIEDPALFALLLDVLPDRVTR